MEADFSRNDLVRITRNLTSHGHKVGEVVKLKYASRIRESDQDIYNLESNKWVFTSEECELVRKC